MGKLNLFKLLIFSVIFIFSISFVFAYTISGCDNMTASGTYYLTNNYSTSSGLATNDTCFVISESNVVFDGGGYVVTDNLTYAGLTIYPDVENITIRNLTLTNFSQIMFLGDETNNNIIIDTIQVYNYQSGTGADGGIYSMGPNVTFKNSIFYHYAESMNNCPILMSTYSGESGPLIKSWNITNNTFVLSNDNNIDSAICLYNDTGSSITNNIFNYTGTFTQGPGYPGNYDMIRFQNTDDSIISGNTFINTGNTIVLTNESENNQISNNVINVLLGMSNSFLYTSALRISDSNNNYINNNNITSYESDALKLENLNDATVLENRIVHSGAVIGGFMAMRSPITVDGVDCDSAVSYMGSAIEQDNFYISTILGADDVDVICVQIDVEGTILNETIYLDSSLSTNCTGVDSELLPENATCIGYVNDILLENGTTNNYIYNSTELSNPTNGTIVTITGGYNSPGFSYSSSAFVNYGLVLLNATSVNLTENVFINSTFSVDSDSMARLQLGSVNSTIVWEDLTSASSWTELYVGSDNLIIDKNLAGINTESGLLGDLNRTAIITLYSLDIMPDEFTPILENDDFCDHCEFISSAADSISFNVTHFSNFSVLGGGEGEGYGGQGEGEGDPPAAVPEFSDYAIMLLLALTVGGFVMIRKQE
ncbi:hypothetical protein HN587_07620 [Candidatus Woesearchaeota archaeon]|jgi:hypothetical protein|nr:hypothetical protein [Candidatus Woesearchaeota archaeon]